MIDARAIARLEAMGVPVWIARTPKKNGSGEAPDAAAAEQAIAPDKDSSAEDTRGGSAPRPGRIRLEAGSGRWLLVIDDAERARHAKLIEDIRAALGTGDCRFGTWSDSPEAGVALADWDAHGIRHALIFGGEARPGFVQAGELAGLAASGDARRELWRQLRSLLAEPGA